MSYQEFIDDVTLSHHEWVDGEVVEMGGVDHDHASICLFLLCLLDAWREVAGAGEIYYRPFAMKLPGELPGERRTSSSSIRPTATAFARCISTAQPTW